MDLEEQGKSRDTKHIYMKYNIGLSPKQKVRIKDICASARKWQIQEKLAGCLSGAAIHPLPWGFSKQHLREPWWLEINNIDFICKQMQSLPLRGRSS